MASSKFRIGFGFGPTNLYASRGLSALHFLPTKLTYVNNSGGATAPLLLYTDITSGPTTGTNEPKGAFLSIFGLGLGNFSDYGTTNHVYIGGVEVDNYRCIQNAVGSGIAGVGNGVYETFGIQRIVVQVGALGTPTQGVPLKIDVVVNGTHPVNLTDGSTNYLDLDGNPLQFTPNPGEIYYVDQAGNDANAGTKASPLRHFQTGDGSSPWGGALSGPIVASSTTTRPPGTHIVIRGGTWTDTEVFTNCFGEFFRFTGTAPTGSAKSGPLVVTSYPGDAGSNAPETVFVQCPSGSGGGFNLSDRARSAETTPWGTTGYCKHIHVVNLKIITAFNSSENGAGGAPINQQTAADFNRIVNCELSFPCTSVVNMPSNNGPTAGGIAGYGSNCRRLGNYIHDVYDPSGQQQNHGTYIGDNPAASGAAVGELHSITAFNVYKDCTGGQGIMMRGSQQTETAPYCILRNNWIQGFGKYGIEIFDGRDRALVWNNVVVAGTTGLAGIVLNSDNVSAVGGIYVGYNTVVGWKTYSGIYQLGGTAGGGSSIIESNIFYQVASAGSTFGLYTNAGGQTTTLKGNVWYDASGAETAKPSGDTTGVFSDPKFANVSTSSLRPATASPAPNAGVTPPTNAIVTPYDAFLTARPQGTNTKYSVGALERVGG